MRESKNVRFIKKFGKPLEVDPTSFTGKNILLEGKDAKDPQKYQACKRFLEGVNAHNVDREKFEIDLQV